jgi:RNA polymerase sigma factor (sigma-70 family)
MNDTQLIQAIQSGGTEEQKAMNFLWNNQNYRQKAKYAYRRSRRLRLSKEEDIFSEAMVKFISKLKRKDFRVDTQLINYFSGICANTCKERYRKENRENEFDTEILPLKAVQNNDTPLEFKLREDLRDALQEALSLIDEKCQELLRLWKLSYSSEEIMQLAGLSSNDVVRVTIGRCKEKLRKKLKNNSSIYEKIKELRWI